MRDGHVIIFLIICRSYNRYIVTSFFVSDGGRSLEESTITIIHR